MRHLLFAIPLVLAASAAMACTTDELADKTKAISTKTRALSTSKNTQSIMAWSKFMAANPAKQGMSIDDACAYYDKLNTELDTLVK